MVSRVKYLKQLDPLTWRFIIAAYVFGMLMRVVADFYLLPGSVPARLLLANGAGLALMGMGLLVVKMFKIGKAKFYAKGRNKQ